MIRELKGKHLAQTLLDLYWISRNPTSQRMPHLRQLSSSQSDTSVKNYILIDFYEWLHQLEMNEKLRDEVEEWKFIEDNLPRYRDFIKVTNYNLNTSERMTEVIENYLTYDYLENIVEMYEIFMREMEKIQLLFLNIYVANNSTNPVAIVPWSYGLNRLCKDIYIIEEDVEDYRSKVVFDPTRKEGVSNKYKVKKYRIKDKTNRVLVDSPLKLFFFEVRKDTENLLPAVWKEFFETTIRREFKGYESRLDLIKGLYSQYTFYGRKELQGTTTPKIGLINYPFFLDGVEGVKDIKEESILTPLDEMNIFIEIKDEIEEKLETRI